MDQLAQQVRRARRRLMFGQFITRLGWSCFATLLLATIGIGVGKLWPVGVPGEVWNASWLGGGLAVGVLAAGIWTYVDRWSPLEAAIEIDRRFELRERVSSTLALSETERQSDIGQALQADTSRRVDRIDVAEGFRIRPSRWSLLPLAPALAAIALAVFVDSKLPEPQAVAATNETAAAQIKKSTDALRKKIEERKQQAKEKGLTDSEQTFELVKRSADELAKKEGVDRKQALVELNNLAKDIQRRREKLGGDTDLRKELNRLKDLKAGPADDLAQALKNGDFNLAQKELEKLKEKLDENKLDAKEKEQLAQQLEQMKQAVQKLADAHQQAQQDLQRQIDEHRQAGRSEQAQKLQEQLDKMAQQNQSMSKMCEACKKLGAAGEALKAGKSPDGKSLQQAIDDLKSLAQSQEDMKMLDQTLDEIAAAKKSMSCKQCGGSGCKECQGEMQAQGQGQNGQDQKQLGGRGLGPGRGKGARPEEKSNTGLYDSQVKQNVGKGGAEVTGLVEGPSRKGEVREQFKEEYEAAKHESADPVALQRLPREVRDHVKEYNDALRKGQQ